MDQENDRKNKTSIMLPRISVRLLFKKKNFCKPDLRPRRWSSQSGGTYGLKKI
jgi:hypothetical protein